MFISLLSLLVTHLSEENKDETKKTLETMKKVLSEF